MRTFGPASLSNLGPGFDAIGLCIEGIGDSVEARLTDEPGIRIEAIKGDRGLLPRDPARNTAAEAARAVLEQTGSSYGLAMRIEKQVPFGSGIGGSAASAVAGAWAANVLLGQPLRKEELIEAVLAGEVIASGGRHGDNVLPALLGGLVLVSASDATVYRRVSLVKALHIAVISPDVQILTKQARAMLPREVGLRDAVHNASSLAFMIDAFHAGDWETVGRCIMVDRLVEPIRATLVPCYDAVKQAAMDAGALGCALTGSGPAMFAIAASASSAGQIARAMVEASETMSIPARSFVTEANPIGACVY